MPAKKAVKKKTSAASKKSKKSAKKSSVSPSAKGFQQSYFNLRERLDAIEMGALYYLMNGETEEEKVKRAEKLMGLLDKPASEITELISKQRTGETVSMARTVSLRRAAVGDQENPCPDGWSLCEGVCVPYPCE